MVDIVTTSLTAARAFARRLCKRGYILLDAPVSGGEAGARAGTLSIMVGGPAAVFARVLPQLQVIGKNIPCWRERRSQVAKACN